MSDSAISCLHSHRGSEPPRKPVNSTWGFQTKSSHWRLGRTPTFYNIRWKLFNKWRRFFKRTFAENIRTHMSPEEHDANYLGILDIKNRRCFKRCLCRTQVRIIFCMFSCGGFLAFLLLCLANEGRTSSTRLIKHMVQKKHFPTNLWTKPWSNSSHWISCCRFSYPCWGKYWKKNSMRPKHVCW